MKNVWQQSGKLFFVYSNLQIFHSLNVDTNVLFDDSSDEEAKPNNDPAVEELSPVERHEATYNERAPDFAQRIHLYLKPTDWNVYILLMICITDWLMSLCFLYF